MEALDILLEISNDLPLRHEAVRLVALVLRTGQAERPVGRQQGKRVPAVIAPGIGSLGSLLEHDMLQAALVQIVAGGKTCLPAADDDRIDFPNAHLYLLFASFAD
jgi:hypothetical protein